MRYLIIGLGIYGSNLARDLPDMGYEVIGADIIPSRVAAIKDYISTAYIIDATDEAAVAALPLKNVDTVIVAIGENFGASIKAVAYLRKLGIRSIFARAVDDVHRAILEGLQVQRIVTPEQRAAHDLACELELATCVTSLRVDDSAYVMRFAAPDFFVGMQYARLTPDTLHGLQLVAACRDTDSRNVLGIARKSLRPLPIAPADKAGEGTDPALKVQAGDVFVCYGSADDFRAMLKRIGAAS